MCSTTLGLHGLYFSSSGTFNLVWKKCNVLRIFITTRTSIMLQIIFVYIVQSFEMSILKESKTRGLQVLHLIHNQMPNAQWRVIVSFPRLCHLTLCKVYYTFLTPFCYYACRKHCLHTNCKFLVWFGVLWRIKLLYLKWF